MSKGMSVKERFSLEFVSATGSIAYAGSKKEISTQALPDLFLFDENEVAAPAAAVVASAGDESVEELRALFGAVGSR